MADCDFLPMPVCIQCGTNQNPCHLKIVGPTLGFVLLVVMAIFCWPAALLCGCCATELGKKTLGLPSDVSNSLNNCIPF
ncbi:hypothetical protein K470DRAFT_255406 [Piedraia hortae CBS 480.64]|uniref:Uncharacterized protein n=1 Tax=Piedraia hortae CBS 480.64 TaxID=1314780 RepID=A0A6A7C887_9PEZI|nr:hypothetical protein K470DRAFT_255406 [Piedraia hortae CBS 480.64]